MIEHHEAINLFNLLEASSHPNSTSLRLNLTSRSSRNSQSPGNKETIRSKLFYRLVYLLPANTILLVCAIDTLLFRMERKYSPPPYTPKFHKSQRVQHELPSSLSPRNSRNKHIYSKSCFKARIQSIQIVGTFLLVRNCGISQSPPKSQKNIQPASQRGSNGKVITDNG